MLIEISVSVTGCCYAVLTARLATGTLAEHAMRCSRAVCKGCVGKWVPNLKSFYRHGMPGAW